MGRKPPATHLPKACFCFDNKTYCGRRVDDVIVTEDGVEASTCQTCIAIYDSGGCAVCDPW